VAVFIMARELAWRTAPHRWFVVVPVLCVAGAEAVLGLVQYDPSIPTAGIRGSYVNRNHFAGLLELSLPFAIVYPIATMRSGCRTFYGALLASLCIALATLILLGIILSLSRMAFAASLTSLFVVGYLTLGIGASWRKQIAVTVLLGFTVIAGFLYLAPDTLVARFGEAVRTDEGSTNLRIRLWTDTLRLVWEYPLVGTGLGTFEQAFQKYKTVGPQLAVDSPHNDYLQLLAELGVVGVAIAAVAMTALLIVASRGAFSGAKSSKRYFAIACVGALITILMHSFTDLNLYIPANAMLFAWISGVVGSLSVDRTA
jgi:O-antigen ligase